jgi:antirestriction protein
MLNVFMNTWGNYNENGTDGGEWVTLPMDTDELSETLERIAEAMGDTDPEWFINDYEWTGELEPRDIGENENIFTINEELEELAALQDYEIEEICAAIEANGYSFAEAMELQQSGSIILYRNMDLTEVAEELVEDCYFGKDTPDIFRTYFDYEAFGRDLSFDGYTETRYGVVYCE